MSLTVNKVTSQLRMILRIVENDSMQASQISESLQLLVAFILNRNIIELHSNLSTVNQIIMKYNIHGSNCIFEFLLWLKFLLLTKNKLSIGVKLFNN
ncbi:MAG: hypothetical protein HW421_2506 [Ignavibacteria bacterium]|nr:hypothetical protein [Ignavibacteria bacterium]